MGRSYLISSNSSIPGTVAMELAEEEAGEKAEEEASLLEKDVFLPSIAPTRPLPLCSELLPDCNKLPPRTQTLLGCNEFSSPIGTISESAKTTGTLLFSLWITDPDGVF